MKLLDKLKKRILVFLLLIVVGAVKAQSFTYQTGQQWNILVEPVEPSLSRFTMIFHTESLNLTQDTMTYGNMEYCVLYADIQDIEYARIGLFREERGKVFYREMDSKNSEIGDEFLLYDWNLSVGDTVFVQQGDEQTGLVLDAVYDTIFNGESHRVFSLTYKSDPTLTEKWIEGIGSELGFPYSGTRLHPINPFNYDMTTGLLCYYKDGNLAWQNPECDTCVIDYWNLDEEETLPLIVYPNPTRSNINICLSNQGKSHLEVFDFTGRRIFESFETGEKCVVDLSLYPRGLYYVKIQNETTIQNKSIIKL